LACFRIHFWTFSGNRFFRANYAVSFALSVRRANGLPFLNGFFYDRGRFSSQGIRGLVLGEVQSLHDFLLALDQTAEFLLVFKLLESMRL
jgi:hypothetical protein